MSSEPTQAKHQQRLRRVALRDVLKVVAEIDEVLKLEFGGKGRGIHSKVDSLRSIIPAELGRRLRYFEAVRSMLMTAPDWSMPDRSAYLEECRAALSRLRTLAQRRERQRRLLAPLRHLLTTFGFMAAFAMAMVFVLLLTSGAMVISA